MDFEKIKLKDIKCIEFNSDNLEFIKGDKKKLIKKEITIKESVQVSVRSQEKRIKQSNEEENTLSRQLGTLIRFSKKIFAPAKQELRAMPMTA